MTHRLHSQDGFALPLTIFVVTIVTLMLAALFIRVQVDRRIAEASGDAIDVLTIAQSGLESYFASVGSVRPPDGDSVRINLGDGYANVIAHVVYEPSDPTANWTYVVRSAGFLINPTMGSDPQARRTIAKFAEWQTGQLDVSGAFTAANKLRHLNQEILLDIDGNDHAATPCGSGAPLYGVRTQAASDADPSGIHGWPQPIIAAQNGDSVAMTTHVDWASSISGGIDPDYTTFTPGWNMGTVQIIDGDLTILDDGGAGILIVKGDLTLSGTYAWWMGIVLVGGRIVFNATTNNVQGVLATGLDALLGGTPPPQGSIGTPNTTYVYYDSCYIQDALVAFSGFRPIKGGWVDNWAGY